LVDRRGRERKGGGGEGRHAVAERRAVRVVQRGCMGCITDRRLLMAMAVVAESGLLEELSLVDVEGRLGEGAQDLAEPWALGEARGSRAKVRAGEEGGR
jgi:hypothetical protein